MTPVRKRTCDVTEKRQFITKVSYNNLFVLHGLNEIKHDYADSKQDLYLQYHVAATDMHFAKNKRHFKQWCTLGFLRLGTNSV